MDITKKGMKTTEYGYSVSFYLHFSAESAAFKCIEFALGLPTSTAFHNENQKQNQFPVNFIETQTIELSIAGDPRLCKLFISKSNTIDQL